MPFADVPALFLDGIIGFCLNGIPRGTSGDFIRWANAQSAPVLALDTPSGIDLTTGTVYDPVVKATATMTLAMPKEGLLQEKTQDLVGELYLADISVPPALYQKPLLEMEVGPIFAENDIVRVR